MIPEFPVFKKIELKDQKEVENLTKNFLPYSDFNFVSMWLWDVNQEMRISQLNSNLVVLFSDYLSGDKFLSFIGKNRVLDTVATLIIYSKNDLKQTVLRLIPDDVIKLLPKNSSFKFIEDRDSFDYIYDTANLSDIISTKKGTISKKLRQFNKLYPTYNIRKTLIKDISKIEYLRLFEKWAINKGIKNFFELNEYKAFERLFHLKSNRINVTSIYVNNELVGFTVCEILVNDYAISHFAKTDTTLHSSIIDVLDFEEARWLNEKGVKYINWEQDLGIEGLRKSKEKYHPARFLKKFEICN